MTFDTANGAQKTLHELIPPLSHTTTGPFTPATQSDLPSTTKKTYRVSVASASPANILLAIWIQGQSFLLFWQQFLKRVSHHWKTDGVLIYPSFYSWAPINNLHVTAAAQSLKWRIKIFERFGFSSAFLFLSFLARVELVWGCETQSRLHSHEVGKMSGSIYHFWSPFFNQ